MRLLLALSVLGYAGAMDIISTSTSSVATSEDVSYQCVLQDLWTAATHPVQYPSNAHWSSPVMVAHSLMYTMWENGGIATPGLEELAEVSTW